MPRFGDSLDLFVQLPDGNAAQFVQATLRDPDGNLLSTVNLINIASGLYLSHAATMPGFRVVYVTYAVYSDSGYMTLNPSYPMTGEIIQLEDASDVAIVGTVDGYSVGFVPLVLGEDRVLNIKLISKNVVLGIGGDPIDLSGVTAISALFTNADGTILTKTLTNGVAILSPLLGTLQVGLLDTETINLRVGERQSFELQLAFGSTIRIVQFLNALSVAARVI